MKKRILPLLLALCLLLQFVPAAWAADEVTGTFERRDGSDLASVRCERSDGSYFFAQTEETETGYRYRFARPDGAYTVRAEYFSTEVWDGAVDLSWYDASQTAFYLQTPAQLAGLAALVNGRLDVNTPDYRVKGDLSQLVSTRVDDFLLAGAGGDNQYGTVYVGDAAHDFSDRTVYLTADMDMGGVCNWTPIGGKYPMDAANSEFVIEAFFNGTLDGQGHRITNLFCDRYAAKGYAYSQAVGLVGYIGELYDGEAAPKAAPSVRNLSVRGSVYGRRMVGGIVGRSGGLPVYIENCANHADVKNTDSKGIGGIIGAGWSRGAIVNCYNTGSVSTLYACPAGGICGSNGGMDIYNCYNVGTVSSSGNVRGRAIGGHNGGSYTVSDCYYLEGCDDDPDSNGWYRGAALAADISVTAMSAERMRSDELTQALNVNGRAYVTRAGGYPALLWEAGGQGAPCAVSLTQPEGGTIESGADGTVPFGTVLRLTNAPLTGWAFRGYTLNGTALTGPYATVTEPAALSGVFTRLVAGALCIQDDPAFTLRVTKDGAVLRDGAAERVTNYPVHSGDALYEGDVLTVTATLTEGAEPEDLSYVYNGKFRYYFTFLDEAGTEKSTDTGKFTVTSQITTASLRLHAVAYTSHKVWTELAQTDWYREDAEVFTLTTARQLAGLAKLVKEGNSFAGKQIRLGANISLANGDKTFNRSVRWFDGIGSTRSPFSGAFDGCGYRITEMTAQSTGSGAALFLATDGAEIKNVRVSGTVAAGGVAAGIVAQAKNTRLTDCVNEAAVTATGEKAGGIAAQIDGASRLERCTNYGSVTGTDGVGGIVGIVSDQDSALTDCINRGAVAANGSGVGVGGVAGRVGGALTRCANYGALTGSGWYMGGVVGACVLENASALTDCYNVGAVQNAHTYAGAGTGGLIGYGNDYRAENCYGYGAVSAAAGTVGGTVGKDSSRSTNVRSNLYYLTGSCAYACGGKAEVSGVAARTAEEFASAAFLRQLDRNGCFAIENGKYPEFAACAHSDTERKNAKAATCTAAGYSGDLCCTLCGALLQEGAPTPPLGHSYRDGKCTVCGVKAPPQYEDFKDLPANAWYKESVGYALANGLMNGTGDGIFQPDGALTRAMLVTILYRSAGEPSVDGLKNPFQDVADGQWYTKAVVWAAGKGIVNGTSETTFDPDASITREQIAAILHRYAGKPETKGELASFPDAATVSDYAKTAMAWTVEKGIIGGSDGKLDPRSNATRAQVAAILMRYLTLK